VLASVLRNKSLSSPAMYHDPTPNSLHIVSRLYWKSNLTSLEQRLTNLGYKSGLQAPATNSSGTAGQLLIPLFLTLLYVYLRVISHAWQLDHAATQLGPKYFGFRFTFRLGLPSASGLPCWWAETSSSPYALPSCFWFPPYSDTDIFSLQTFLPCFNSASSSPGSHGCRPGRPLNQYFRDQIITLRLQASLEHLDRVPERINSDSGR
jgi:hypothetical protein